MHKHAPSAVEAILDEFVGRGEVLQQVLRQLVLGLDGEVRVGREEGLVERLLDHRQHVRDVRGFDFAGPVDGVQAEGCW